MNVLLRAFFRQKKFPRETWPEIDLGQDPDPDVFKSQSGQKRPDPQHWMQLKS
jgi:hypothetical protein